MFKRFLVLSFLVSVSAYADKIQTHDGEVFSVGSPDGYQLVTITGDAAQAIYETMRSAAPQENFGQMIKVTKTISCLKALDGSQYTCMMTVDHGGVYAPAEH